MQRNCAPPQLQALTGVAAIISSNLQPEELIASLLDQLEAILPFKTGTLWLREGKQMFVRMARGFVDTDERIGLSISVEDSKLVEEMIATCQPIVVGDVTNDPRFPALVENPNLSWMGLPLVAGGGVIGVIALEMDEANFYTTEHVQIATAFAGQAAVALGECSIYTSRLSPGLLSLTNARSVWRHSTVSPPSSAALLILITAATT